MWLKNNLAWLLAVVLVLTACGPQQLSKSDLQPPWSPADIRALQDPGEDGSHLVGLSLRQLNGIMQVRVDFLDLSSGLKLDLHLAFDLYGQGQPLSFVPDFHWDARIDLPSDTEPQGLRADGTPWPGFEGQVTRDLEQGIVILSFDLRVLPGSLRPFRLLVWNSLPGQLAPLDLIGPVRSDSPAPAGRAAVVLAFWDTLPAATPAQALRRWDGAHTGPFGQRHGLRTLLDLALENKIPLFLLDLKKPASLSALDGLGGTSLVKNLAASGLITLPDVAWGDPQVSAGLESSQEAGQLAELPGSLYLSGASTGQVPARYRAAFASFSGGQVVVKDNLRLVPLPEGKLQVEAGGLSVDARRALLEMALSAGPASTGAAAAATASLVVMGGSLPASGWGDIFAGGKAMRYLADHPWIQVLNGGDLLTWPACSAEVCLPDGLPCPERVCPQVVETQPEASLVKDTLRSHLDSLALDPLDPAWQSYLTLTDPQASTDLQALRRNYLGQVGGLVAAAEWARAPYTRSACDRDLDGDGQAECVLASTDFFGLFDPLGARLVFGFIRNESTVEQIVGPASQFAVGLSDPGGWRLDGGLAADPAEIGGGFFDATGPWLQYQSEAQAGLVFTSPDGKTQKTFQLMNGQLQATYRVPGSLSTRLPLVTGSQGRFSPGWLGRYHSQVSLQAWTWDWGDTHLQVTTTGQLKVITFLDSLPWLQTPEDPNRGYPPGHYLPFPLAVAEIQGVGTFSVVLSFR